MITELTRMGGTNGFLLVGVGTQGSSTNMHEGRSGWTLAMFYNGSGGLGSPFTNGLGSFDFHHYLTNNNIMLVSNDWVIIDLGINDVFNQTTDAGVITIASNFVAMASNVVINVTNVITGVRVGIALPISPVQSQDAFSSYGAAGQYWNRYARNHFLLTEYLIAHVSSPARLLALNACLDTVNNFPTTDVPANARNTNQVTIYVNALHPTTSGWFQIADQYWAFLKCFE